MPVNTELNEMVTHADANYVDTKKKYCSQHQIALILTESNQIESRTLAMQCSLYVTDLHSDSTVYINQMQIKSNHSLTITKTRELHVRCDVFLFRSTVARATVTVHLFILV